jgi:hypothetical protein
MIPGDKFEIEIYFDKSHQTNVYKGESNLPS